MSQVSKSPLPDAGDMLFIFLVSLPLFTLPMMLFGDGSTGWHIAVGDHILKTGVIPTTDFLTASHAGKPWVAYQWLADTIMALLVKAGGLNLLAVACSISIGSLFLLLYDRSRREGLGVFPSLILVVCGSLLAALHFLARPHLFNFWGVYIFSTKLEDFARGRITLKWLAIWLSVAMLIWVNTHPAFALGIGITGCYLLGFLLDAVTAPAAQRVAILKARCLPILALIAGFCVISLINPYGIGLHEYILQYLKKTSVISQTDEFMSPVFHGNLHSTCLEMYLFFLITGLYRRRGTLFARAQNVSSSNLLAVLVFTHMALQAVRNMPLFAIISIPTIARLWGNADATAAGDTPAIQAETSEITDTTETSTPTEIAPAMSIFDRIKKAGRDFEEQELACKMHVLPILFSLFLIVAALMGGSVAGTRVLTSDFNPKFFPTKTLEYIQQNNLEPARGFNYDNWGGYLGYKLQKPVFMDDRADFFEQDFYLDYANIARANPGFEDVLKKHKLYWVIMPTNSIVGEKLKSTPGWTLAAEDKGSRIYVNQSLKTP